MFDIVASALFFLVSPVDRTRDRLLTHARPAICSILVTFFNNLTKVITDSAGDGKGIVPNITVTATLVPPLYATKFKLTDNGLCCFFNTFCLCFVGAIFVDLTACIIIHLLGCPGGIFLGGRHRGVIAECIKIVIFFAVIPDLFLDCGLVQTDCFGSQIQAFITSRLDFPGARVLDGAIASADSGGRIGMILVNRAIPRAVVTGTHTGVPGCNLGGINLIIRRNFKRRTASVGRLGDLLVRSLCGGDRRILQTRSLRVSSLGHSLGGCRDCGRLASRLVPRVGILFPCVGRISYTRACLVSVSDVGPSAILLICLGDGRGMHRTRRRGVGG